MPILLLLLAPILEIWVVVRVGAHFGVVNTLFALAAGAILGGGIAKAQGRFIVQSFQNSVARGEVPTTKMVHNLLILLGGALLFIPGFLSDAVGLMFIIPGPRHLFALWVRRKMLAGFNKGAFQVFSMGGFKGGFGGAATDSVRDVTPKSIEASDAIIDIAPISKEEKSD
ncbi:MAG TPA: FxsA family protein [Bdellovibrionales bacterium]|nr:FxsA family protein [Bdellovibrionales bacterium]